MRTGMSLCVWFLFVSFQSVAQPAYYHYEFSSQDQIFYIDLITSDSSGHLTFNASFLTHPALLDGKIDPKTGEWQFASYREDEIKLHFRLINKELEGLGMENRVGETFVLPKPALVWNKGNVPFKMHYFKSKQKLFPEFKDSPAAFFDFLFPDPQWAIDPNVNDSIRKALLKIYIGEEIYPKQATTAINSYIHALGRQYQEDYRDMFDSAGFNELLNHEFTVYPNILCNTGFILTIGINKYVYSGGAHGLEAEQFVNLNLKNGKNYSINDLFNTENRFIAGKLQQLIHSKLKEQFGLKENQKLTEAGFFDDKIDLPAEFFITPLGIGFYYNVYEIAPYAMGPVSVFLRWNEVKGLMGESFWILPTEFLSQMR